jgi:hypothetical protein
LFTESLETGGPHGVTVRVASMLPGMDTVVVQDVMTVLTAGFIGTPTRFASRPSRCP